MNIRNSKLILAALVAAVCFGATAVEDLILTEDTTIDVASGTQAYGLLGGTGFKLTKTGAGTVTFTCVTNETVEINVDGVWLKIPDGTVTVNGRSSGSLSVKFESGEEKSVMITNGVPLGKTLESRRFLGFIRPNGKFEACSNDPFVGEEGRRRMGHETDWAPRGLTDKLPFEIEDGKRQRYCSRRLRLKSGKTLEIVHESFSPETCGIYRLASDE